MASLKTSILLTCFILYLTIVSCSQKKPKVIVIGAGAAGIAAGSRLLQNDIDDVIVLEAENRIGGRIHTIEFEDVILELGSQSLNVKEDHAIFTLANNTNLIKLTQLNVSKSEFVDLNGYVIPKETSIHIQSIFNNILYDLETMSNSKKNVKEDVEERYERTEELHKINKNLVENYFEWNLQEQTTYFAVESMYEISSKAFAEYYRNSYNKVWVWNRPGMKTLLDALMNKFPETSKAIPLEQKIVLNKTVTNINWSLNNKTNVIVSCSDGSQYVADYVIVTVSLGVLKDHIDTLFTPELPEPKKAAIKYMGYGTTDVIYLKFPHRWWPEAFQGFSFLWNANTTEDVRKALGDKYQNKKWIMSMTGFYPVDFQNEILAVYLSGTDAIDVETLTDFEVLRGCLEALKLFVGNKYKIPDSVSMIRSKWYTNPHFRGVNSYRSNESFKHNISSNELAEWLYLDVDHPLVLFAGEATSANHYASVHGAILTGWKAADDIICLCN